jgi:lysophospholipase L1-like esterase
VSSSYLYFNRIVLAIVASVILTACGGGGGGSTEDSATSADMYTPSRSTIGKKTDKPNKPSPGDSSSGGTSTEQPAPTQPAQALVIDYYGDSTIWGYESGTGARVDTPAPAAFAAALPDPSRYTVRNEGVNSSDACQLLNGRDGKHPAWDTQMASSNANVVIFNFLINDQWRMSIDQYKSCLTSLAVKAKSYGKKVIFETPNPTLNDMSTYVSAMKAVAVQQGAPVIDQHKYLLDYLNGRSAYTICPDGLHPTDNVYVMKGKYAAGEFSKLGY